MIHEIQAIPEITQYQQDVLHHIAQKPMPVLPLARPSRGDSSVTVSRLRDRRRQMQELVSLGLMENVTSDFRESLRKHKRKFSVYALTEWGFLMFHDCSKRAVN